MGWHGQKEGMEMKMSCSSRKTIHHVSCQFPIAIKVPH